MRLITSAITVAFPSFDFTFLVPEFADRLTRELDFELEGRMCERAGRALADDPRMVTPDVYWELTTAKVLTMEFVRGAKIDDGPGLRAAGVDPREAAEALADTFARTLLCHGFVHGESSALKKHVPSFPATSLSIAASSVRPPSSTTQTR